MFKNKITRYGIVFSVALLGGCTGETEDVPAENTASGGPPSTPQITSSKPANPPPVAAPPVVPGGGLQAPAPVAGGMSGTGEDPLKLDSEEGFAVQINDVQEGVEAYFDEKEVKPTSLQQVIQAGFLTKLPTLPAGKRFVLDPETLVITVQ